MVRFVDARTNNDANCRAERNDLWESQWLRSHMHACCVREAQSEWENILSDCRWQMVAGTQIYFRERRSRILFKCECCNLLTTTVWRIPIVFRMQEEAWEWGNPKASENVPCVDQIGRAAHRWRKQLQAKAASSNSTDKVGAFSNFRVILHSRKKDAFRNLLEAGGGCLLDVR